MLKFLWFLMFLILLCFKKKNYWMVQNSLFLLGFLLILSNNYNNYLSSVSFFLGCDLISYGLIILSVWICGLMLMASEQLFFSYNFVSYFLVLIVILLLTLMLTFLSSSLFLFYLFFESSLIPTFFLILGWGYQPERLQAGAYLLFYTLLASLPMLLVIFYVFNINFSLSFFLLKEMKWNLGVYIFLILAFLVKMPMYFVHLWLPKAHVEAPIAGSMILAGILLKLGGYGLIRVFPILVGLGLKFNFIWVTFSLVGGVLVSLICLRQTDLKALIAYSSVAHMGIVLSGLLTLFSWGLSGAYALMLAHGLCSSGLFCLANICYERVGSRSLLINKGLINFMPSLTLWWFLLVSCNMAAPPSLSLLGEICLLNSIVAWSWVSMISLMLLSFFSAAYSLYLYSYSQHGKLSHSFYSYSGGVFREYLLLLLHWGPLNYLILKGDSCLLWL